MNIKKTGYIISAIFYLVNFISSYTFKLNTQNTWWALLGILIIITPSFIQTIFNIKKNKDCNGIVVLYVVLGLLILFYITGILIISLGVFGVLNMPLY